MSGRRIGEGMASDVPSGPVSVDAEVMRLRTELALERRARRHRGALHELAAATGAVITRRGVATAIVDRAGDLLRSGWASVAFVGDDDIVHFVHGPTMPDAALEAWSEAPLDIEIPINAVLRGDSGRIELPDECAIREWSLLDREIDRLEMSSLVIEPIRPTNGRPLAALAVAWPESHTMGELEREVLAEIVDAASPAFERALRTESDHDVAETLQNWLIPPSVPATEHLEIGTLYRPGTDERSVGGDWYDVVRLRDDATALIVGDVVGHDLRAAAEMGQVRHVVASQLLASGDLAAALELTDRYFSGREIDTMATALVMVLDAATASVSIASAGHLPPVIREPGGTARVAECGLGPPIGSGLGGYTAVTRPFPRGSLLVAFTDGILERRDQPIDESLTELCGEIDLCLDGLSRAAGPRGSKVAVMRLLRERSDRPWRNDDIAALVVCDRIHGEPG